ncbi:hypothetical protein [Sediminibacillus massiliensis]|uniref:hypothetical protein n=1 Tax=Sediminibacillus massiliensis TaxID=1926277 RepID=UPI0009888B73|nr:hypothetical protein [Sediminibacillus massiliensis]
MKKYKSTIFTVLITIFMMLLLSLFSPYNVLYELNENNLIQNDSFLQSEFDKEDVKEVEYIGDHTYIIEKEKTEYIARKDYTSVMNYQWTLYEYEKSWGAGEIRE